MKHKLTDEQRGGLRRWLKLHRVLKPSKCPFSYSADCVVCRSWFPRIESQLGSRHCPCRIYDLGEVIKTAKKMLVYPAHARESKK